MFKILRAILFAFLALLILSIVGGLLFELFKFALVMAVVLVGLLIFAAIAFFFYLVLWEKARYFSDMFLIL